MALIFSESEPAHASKQPHDRSLQDMLRRALRQSGAIPLLAAAVAYAAIAEGAGAAVALAGKPVLDTIVPSGQPSLLETAAGAFFAIAAFAVFAGFSKSVILALARRKFDCAATAELFRRVLSARAPFLASHTTGDLLGRVGSNGPLRQMITDQILGAVLDTILLVAYGSTLALLDWRFAAIEFALIVVHFSFLATVWPRSRALAVRETAEDAEQQAFAVGLLRGAAQVRAMGFAACAAAEWRRLMERQLATAQRASQLAGAYSAISSSLILCGPLAVIFGGALLVTRSQTTIGSLFAAVLLSSAMLSPVVSLAGFIQALQTMRAHAARIADLLSNCALAKLSPPSREPGPPPKIEIRDLNFAYPGAAPLFQGLSCTFEAGKKTVILGPSGSGKSTLIHLILGALRQSNGRILLDGSELEPGDPLPTKVFCGAVFQNAALFGTTLRDAVTFGNPGASDAEILDALDVAGIADLARLPMGLETCIGEDGANFSGGQRQRIAIARAVLGRPRLLVLDEATSNLDPETERSIDRALSCQTCTLVWVTHRLSMARSADRVIVIREGQVAPQGSCHDFAAGTVLTSDAAPPPTPDPGPSARLSSPNFRQAETSQKTNIEAKLT